MSNTNTDDYIVGYAKPPKEHQYPPGTSGNPKGRPKNSSAQTALSIALYESLRRSLDRKIEATENGRRKRMTIREILVGKQIQQAMKDPRARNELFKMIERADRADLEGRAGEPITIEVIGGLPDTEPGPEDLPGSEV